MCGQQTQNLQHLAKCNHQFGLKCEVKKHHSPILILVAAAEACTVQQRHYMSMSGLLYEAIKAFWFEWFGAMVTNNMGIFIA